MLIIFLKFAENNNNKNLIIDETPGKEFSFFIL